MNKVLLILPTWNAGKFFHHGIQYISAGLTEYGVDHDIAMLDKPEFSPREYYDIIGFTATSFEYPHISEIVKGWVKKPICVIGGAYASVMGCTETDGFDYCCQGEGDRMFALYCKYNEPSFLSQNDVISNLDSLPDYLSGKMPLQDILDAKHGWLSVLVSRGCPFSCGYCINSLHKTPMRRMSVDHAIDHINSLVKHLKGVKYINFDDDNLVVGNKWITEFLPKYKATIGLPYVINVRACDMTDDIARLLHDTGCYEVQTGVECGDEVTRSTILNKGMTNEAIGNSFDLCHKYNLRTLAYVMHGIPMTNGTSPYSTATLIRRLKPTLIRDTYLYPFEGTPIRKLCESNDIAIRKYDDDIFSTSCIDGHDGEKELFRRAISDIYQECQRNKNYLELK